MSDPDVERQAKDVLGVLEELGIETGPPARAHDRSDEQDRPPGVGVEGSHRHGLRPARGRGRAVGGHGRGGR